MPITSSLGALTTTKGSFFSATTGNGWISIGPGGYAYFGPDATSQIGTGIGLDSGGNVFTALATGTNTNGGYALKFDANTGNNIYNTATLRGPGITAGSGNVFICQNNARIVSGVPTYSIETRSSTNSNLTPITTLQVVATLTSAFNFPDFYGIRNVNGDIYTLSAYGATNEGKFFKMDANNNYRQAGTIRSTVGGTTTYVPNDFCFTPDGNSLYTVGYIFLGGPANVSFVLSKAIKSGSNFVNSWHKEIGNISISVSNICSLAADNNNVYVTTPAGISKLDNTGNVVIQKGPSGNGKTKLAVDSSGNVYALYSDNFVKFDSNLDVIYNNRFIVNNSPGGQSAPLGIISDGNYVYAASTRLGLQYTYKVPADGSIPGQGVYRAGPYIIRYVTSNLSQSNTFVTFTTTSNVTCGISGSANVAPVSSSATFTPDTAYKNTEI
jgi:hypothetical protein